MIIKLLTEHHFEFLSLKGGCRGSSECTLVKMSNCWKSHAGAQFFIGLYAYLPVLEQYPVSCLSHVTLLAVSFGENSPVVYSRKPENDYNPAMYREV